MGLGLGLKVRCAHLRGPKRNMKAPMLKRASRQQATAKPVYRPCHVNVHACVHVRLHVRVHARVHVCMRACACMCARSPCSGPARAWRCP